MTIEEMDRAIQALVEAACRPEPLECYNQNTGLEKPGDPPRAPCINAVKHYGVPFDGGAGMLCPACEVLYHVSMARNALINYRRTRPLAAPPPDTLDTIDTTGPTVRVRKR